MNESPLGAAALAGTSYPIDRHKTAAALGFREPTRNSIDSVSDRDFALEFLSVAAINCHASVAAGRGNRHLALRPSSASCGLSDSFLHRLLDHAAEEEPRRRRPGAGQDRQDQRRSRLRCSRS